MATRIENTAVAPAISQPYGSDPYSFKKWQDWERNGEHHMTFSWDGSLNTSYGRMAGESG